MALAYEQTTKRGWYIFAIMLLAYMISNFHQIGLSAISIQVGADLGTDAAGLALLVSAFAYPYAALQIPGGLLVDTLGSRKSVTCAMLLVCAGTLLFAEASSLGLAFLGRVCIGAGSALILVPLMKLTAVWFPPAGFAKLLAAAFTVGALGLALATSPMAILQEFFGWRAIYLFLAGVTLLCALFIWLIVRDTRDAFPSMVTVSRQQVWLALKTVLRNREAWLLGIWVFCQAGAYFAFIGLWAGQYLHSVQGLDAMEAGGILTLPAFGLVLGPLLIWAAERCNSARRVIKALALGALLLSLPLALGLPKLPPFLLSGYFICLSICTISGTALAFSMVKALFSVEFAGTASGFINIFPFAGAAAIQQGIGEVLRFALDNGLETASAFSCAFWVMSVSAFIACVASVFMHTEKM
ncbi:MFS transporter [Desulfovibrio sp. OttesenSCG-928-G15]|nr:MFS transporter [Desulfovibrio sp. OttesenSCG-928-G15]